ncbi:MAG: hypothetical protein Q8K60_04215 [Parachlamydiaceae bacterium]|nr:hypothetical protein [Parachlamydiaceae bacterium]
MSFSIDHIIKFPFENLTTVNFGKTKHSFYFRFIKSYETTEPAVINERTLMPKTWKQVSFPDMIRFSPRFSLVKKIQELSQDIELHYLPCSYGRESGYYEIPAIHSTIFLRGIRLLQANQSKICIPKQLFQKLLHKLQEHDYAHP